MHGGAMKSTLHQGGEYNVPEQASGAGGSLDATGLWIPDQLV